MNKECTHRQFYGQFVHEGTKCLVLSFFGFERLAKSTDEHLNDIPLHMWDRIQVVRGVNPKLWKDAHQTDVFSWSMSDNVCVAKEAARQIIKGSRQT